MPHPGRQPLPSRLPRLRRRNPGAWSRAPRAAGVTRMVTICTRLRQAPQVRAIAEAHPGVFWAAGTHPMHAAEEPMATVEDARRPGPAPEVRRHRRDRPRLPLHRRERRRAAGEPAPPHRGRARHRPPPHRPRPRRRRRHGPHPRRGARRRPLRLRDALLHLRRGAGRDRPLPRLLPLHLRHRDLPQRRRARAPSSPPPRATACWSRPTAPTSPRSRTAASATSPPTPPTPPASWPPTSASTARRFAALTTANFDRLFPKAAA